jgi:hypothetical protein
VLATNRWRNWQPQAEKSGVSARISPPKPPKPTSEGFEGVTQANTTNFVTASEIAPQAQREVAALCLDYWRQSFNRWLNSSCLRRPRWFGGLTCLHLSFCEWQSAMKAEPCDRETFIALLCERDYLVGEVEETALVSGLALKEDVRAFERDPAPTVRKRTAA